MHCYAVLIVIIKAFIKIRRVNFMMMMMMNNHHIDNNLLNVDSLDIHCNAVLNEGSGELFARNEEERFVMVLKRKDRKSGGGGNNDYRCRYCGLKITGGPAKIRGHFLDGNDGGQRVKKCTAPSDPNISGNNFEAVNFICNKKRANEGVSVKHYRKRGRFTELLLFE